MLRCFFSHLFIYFKIYPDMRIFFFFFLGKSVQLCFMLFETSIALFVNKQIVFFPQFLGQVDLIQFQSFQGLYSADGMSSLTLLFDSIFLLYHSACKETIFFFFFTLRPNQRMLLLLVDWRNTSLFGSSTKANESEKFKGETWKSPMDVDRTTSQASQFLAKLNCSNVRQYLRQ